MNAYLFIRGKRKSMERIDFVNQLMVARSNKQNYEKALTDWARDAEMPLWFED
jgi:hypothetical protein